MNDKFLITNIHRVIMVGKEEYPERITEFKSKKLIHNELILHLSGESTVHFNGLELPTSPGVIRFLPTGENNRYTVTRVIPGDCIDVFFDTDVPVSDTAFVMDMSKRGNIAPLFKRSYALGFPRRRGTISSAFPSFIKYLPKCKRVPISQASTMKRYVLRWS